MPAYMIISVQLHDRERFVSEYANVVAPLIAQFGGRYLLMARNAELLEGSFGAGASVVISQWPDRAAVKAFWESSQYQALKTVRAELADCQVLLIESDTLLST